MSTLSDLMKSTAEPATQNPAAITTPDAERSLEEGELYVVRKGQLEHLARNEEDGMRRIRITEDAFQIATDIGRGMRKSLQGYKPDVSLITSALVLSYTDELQKGQDAVKTFVLKMFQSS